MAHDFDTCPFQVGDIVEASETAKAFKGTAKILSINDAVPLSVTVRLESYDIKSVRYGSIRKVQPKPGVVVVTLEIEDQFHTDDPFVYAETLARFWNQNRINPARVRTFWKETR